MYMKINCWFNRNRLLSHLRRCFCALAIAGASLTLPGAEASGPEPASGGFFPCFNFAGPPRQVGENLIIRFNVTGTGTGTLTGSFDGTEMDVVHPDGSITLEGRLVFTGSVGTRTGTLLFTYNGIGNINTGHENLRGENRTAVRIRFRMRAQRAVPRGALTKRNRQKPDQSERGHGFHGRLIKGLTGFATFGD